MTSKRLAGIDIGTLTCRLLIADLPANNRLNELCSERRILRLGEGVDQSKRLKHEAVDRVIQWVREWRTTIERYRVDAQVAVATSAVRDAANKQEFTIGSDLKQASKSKFSAAKRSAPDDARPPFYARVQPKCFPLFGSHEGWPRLVPYCAHRPTEHRPKSEICK